MLNPRSVVDISSLNRATARQMMDDSWAHAYWSLEKLEGQPDVSIGQFNFEAAQGVYYAMQNGWDVIGTVSCRRCAVTDSSKSTMERKFFGEDIWDYGEYNVMPHTMVEHKLFIVRPPAPNTGIEMGEFWYAGDDKGRGYFEFFSHAHIRGISPAGKGDTRFLGKETERDQSVFIAPNPFRPTSPDMTVLERLVHKEPDYIKTEIKLLPDCVKDAEDSMPTRFPRFRQLSVKLLAGLGIRS